MRSWIAALALGVLMIGVLSAGMADAQDGARRNLVRTPLERPVIQELRQWLLNRSEPGEAPPPIAFKVPAGEVSRVVCRLDRLGIVCVETLEPGICPREVEVVIEGGGRATVPVDCTGPDADGNCECDFAQ